ncbi:MAG: cysteine desulfurase [bacterium]
MKNIEKRRGDFPILHQQVNGHPLSYLDNAATTQKPRAVIDALVRFYEQDNSNVHRGIHTLSNRSTEAFENARKRVAQFINAAETEEIVFTRGTTESINLVAASWGAANLRANDTILLTEMEHHSNLVPWQMLAAKTGARLKFLPVNLQTGLLDLEPLPQLLKNGVKIFAFTHISNTLGTVNPVEDICKLARQHGVVTLIDAAQSAGHRPLDVQRIGCDFLAFSSHKTCGPTGIGVLYGRRALLEAMPPYQGGGEMINSVTLESSSYKPAPHKFEAGTPNIAGAVGLRAALDYLDEVGRENIARHDRELAAYAYQRLSEINGLNIIGPAQNRAGLVSFYFKDIHAHDIVHLADQEGIALRGGHHCNQPLMRKFGIASTARASFYFYNTPEEIDYLVAALQRIQKFLNRGT